MAQALATVLAALISAFLGSWIGAWLAATRFKRERAFDRQLDWYERMVRCFYKTAEQIEIALTFQAEPGSSDEQLHRVWEGVQHAHLELDRVIQEAALYGSAEAIRVAKRTGKIVQRVADATGAFDPPSATDGERAAMLQAIEQLPAKLYDSAEPLAAEARRHLGIT